jgi:hypothetical protein
MLHTLQICNRAGNVEDVQSPEDVRGNLITLCRCVTLAYLSKLGCRARLPDTLW